MHLLRSYLAPLIGGAFLFALSSCSKAPASSGSAGSEEADLFWVASTGHIHDALEQLTAGTGARIKLLCGPGVDPHSYSASTRDVQAMGEATGVIVNGFHLEDKLSPLLEDERFAPRVWYMSSAFPEDARLDWVEDGEINPEAPFDPHIWNHLAGWSKCVEALALHLSEVDPEHRDLYAQQSEAYVGKLLEADVWAQAKLAELPEDKRFLVSAHDAFGYFSKVYGLKTFAVLGVGNDPEPAIQAMQAVTKFVCDNKVPVIFLESITNAKVTLALQEACAARGVNVRVAKQPLYSDDLGEEPPADTHLGAFRTNVNTIMEVSAL